MLGFGTEVSGIEGDSELRVCHVVGGIVGMGSGIKRAIEGWINVWVEASVCHLVDSKVQARCAGFRSWIRQWG